MVENLLMGYFGLMFSVFFFLWWNKSGDYKYELDMKNRYRQMYDDAVSRMNDLSKVLEGRDHTIQSMRNDHKAAIAPILLEEERLRVLCDSLGLERNDLFEKTKKQEGYIKVIEMARNELLQKAKDLDSQIQGLTNVVEKYRGENTRLCQEINQLNIKADGYQATSLTNANEVLRLRKMGHEILDVKDLINKNYNKAVLDNEKLTEEIDRLKAGKFTKEELVIIFPILSITTISSPPYTDGEMVTTKPWNGEGSK